MPASVFDATSAASVHCGEDYDSELAGIPSRIQGLKLKSVTPKPSRDWNTLTAEFGQNFMWIGTKPAFEVDLDGKDMLTDGLLSNAPIGKPLTRAQVAVFNSLDNYGFSTAAGYFFLKDVTPARNAGAEPRDNKTTLTLVFTPTDSVNHVTPP